MALFHDPKDEDRICQALKAYVEEWGPENVTILVPAAWKGYEGNDGFGSVKLYCSTEDTVSILASEDGQAKCNFTIRLKQVVTGNENK
jgi:hypothetical protein